MVDAIPSYVLKRRWDTIEDNSKCPVIFVSLKVHPLTSRVKVTLVQIAWLALFDENLEQAMVSEDAHRRPCISPLLKLMAYEEPIRLFEVLVDDFVNMRAGPVDAIVGLMPHSCPKDFEVSFTVYDDRTTSQKIFALNYYPLQTLDVVVKANDFYVVQPLWMDTIIPICNCSTSLLMKTNMSGTNAKLLCAVFDPWVKLNIATASSFRMPDGSLWPVLTRMKRHCIDLPDIESAQRLEGSFERTITRNASIFKELIEAVWNPKRLERLGMFEDEEDIDDL